MDQYLTSQDTHYKTGFHGKPLIIAWLPLANFAVLCASIKWCKYTFYYHVILGLAVIVLTLLSTVHILIDDWVSPNQDFKIQKVHNIAGLAVTIWLGIQVVTGVLARVIQYSPKVKTRTCVWIKKVHHISSYLIMLVSKFNYLNIKFMKGKYAEFCEYFIIQLLFLALYLWIKSSYWTLSEEIVDGQLTIQVKSQNDNKFVYFLTCLKNTISSIKAEIMQKTFNPPILHRDLPILKSQRQIQTRDYVLFNDVVYNIQNLKYRHPGGQNIINLMRKREVNRFLYGYYRPQNDHKTITHVHTKQSLRLCGQPVAKVVRTSPMSGFDGFVKFQLVNCHPISPNSCVHLIGLSPKSLIKIKYSGYNHQSQFGQHLSLTLSNKGGRKRCTRLYTTVWCMRSSNLDFIETHYKCSIRPKQKSSSVQKIYFRQKKPNFSLTESLIETITNQSELYLQNDEVIPLVIKKYKKGSLTSRLFGDQFQGEIVLSTPMGAGLNYHQLQHEGKVIFVCGGTGLLPFCDLIDILFKRLKVLEGCPSLELIKINDPLAAEDVIRKRNFIFYYAAQTIADIPPITIYQLHYLSLSPHIDLKVYLKIKKDWEIAKQNYNLFEYQSQPFNAQVEKHLTEEREKINKIYVCGPFRMNQEISKLFQKHSTESRLYEFV